MAVLPDILDLFWRTPSTFATVFLSHRRGRPLQSSTKKRRETILDCAAQLVDERGDTSFTMDEVAERAGVARVTVYRYFKSKKFLLKTLVDERNAPFNKVVLRDTRDRILDAAESVIESSGVRGATVYEIADEAGLGAATVYRHFGDRNRLMGAFVRERTPRKVVASALQKRSANVERDMRAFAAEALQLVADKREIIQLLASEHPNRPDLLEVFVKAQTDSTKLLLGFFDRQIEAGYFRDIEARDLAISFFGMILSFAWMAPSIGIEVPEVEKQAEIVTQLFLRGIVTPKGAETFNLDGETGEPDDASEEED